MVCIQLPGMHTRVCTDCMSYRRLFSNLHVFCVRQCSSTTVVLGGSTVDLSNPSTAVLYSSVAVVLILATDKRQLRSFYVLPILKDTRYKLSDLKSEITFSRLYCLFTDSLCRYLISAHSIIC